MKVMNWIKENKILVLLVLVGSLFRFYKLDFQSPWIDEIFTLNNTQSEKSFIEIYRFLKQRDPHPPLYYFTIHFFYLIFENTSLVARAISALFGVAGLFAIYYLGKELLNKKVGLIAVAFLVVNYFHIYYSQEARMYSMLFFTTTMSFLYLVKFIKKPTLKSAILHSVFALIMIYTHFFALFALFSQYLILLFFVIKPYQSTPKKVFLLSILSGVSTLILYIPALLIFLQTSERTSIWITIPEKDVYTVMFKEFFGFSEIVLFISFLSITYFFLILFNKKETKKFYIDPIKEKEIFTFFILFVWIFITIFIPLIVSYINLPMIVSRYFINILPALLILIATGIYHIKNNLVKATFIVLFILFSVSDVFIVKKYYSSINKTQIREVSNYINEKKDNNDQVFSSLSYYFNYYLNVERKSNQVNSLDEYLNAAILKPNELKSFWYADCFGKKYNINENTKAILDSVFIIDDNVELYDAYAKHFILKKDYKSQINIDKYSPFNKSNGAKINCSIENYTENEEIINFSGWAYFEDKSMKSSSIFLILQNSNSKIVIPFEKVIRQDVTTYFKSKFDISYSGFNATINKNNIKKGDYNLLIYIVDKLAKTEGLILTDKKITITNKS